MKCLAAAELGESDRSGRPVDFADGLSRRFARVVRHWLQRMGVSARELARRSGLHERTTRRIVNGEQSVNLEQAEALAEGMDMKASEVVALAENEGENLAEGRT